MENKCDIYGKIALYKPQLYWQGCKVTVQYSYFITVLQYLFEDLF